MFVRKTPSRTSHRANVTIAGLGFFLWGSYFPVLWDLSISSTVIILSFMFSQIVLMATSSVTSPLHYGVAYRSMQYHFVSLKQLFCHGFSNNCLLKNFFFCFLSFWYLSNLALIKSTGFLQLVHVHLPFKLGFLFCFDHRYHFVHFLFNTSQTFNWNFTVFNDYKLSVNTSSNAVLFKAKESLKLHSLVFL